MSRIHEAISKAAHEQKVSTQGGLTSVEEILSAGFLVSGGTHAAAQREKVQTSALSAAVSPGSCRKEEWFPDNKTMLFLSEAAHQPAREQFRAMRTKLNRLREQRPLTVMAITSALSGEGKTFVSANLAHALGLQREQRVLLIDADLRRGSLAGVLGAPIEPGLSEFLRGVEPVEKILQQGENGSLYLIPSGARIQDAGELIGGSRFRELILRLKPEFDWILIDTPPATQFADAGVIAGMCDGVILVFGSGMTPVHLAKRMAREFKKQSILGAVLNRTDDAIKDAKYFNYYADYGK
jgi:capsular exopolysaccharide synthesis family protein